jgi:Inner membrane protein YgaP-like, transmembrane domain
MSSNVNGIDRIVRVVIAIVAVALAAALGFGTVGSWILLAVAAIMLVTAAVGFCPLYRLLGVSTKHAQA